MSDLNKGVSSLHYNSLSLPRQVDIKSPVADARHEYTYSADGRKLKVVQKWNPSFIANPIIGSAINVSSLTSSFTTDYVGNIIYENGTLKRMLIEGGYYEAGEYYFYLMDHLGNNRVVAKANGTVMQKSHYYPFGNTFAESTNKGLQPYQYNGKELEQRNGLNLYDYGARFYDPVIGRWSTVDPLAEQYGNVSPYNYALNNPIKFIDPDGRSITLTGEAAKAAFIDLKRSKSNNSSGWEEEGEEDDDPWQKKKYLNMEEPNKKDPEKKNKIELIRRYEKHAERVTYGFGLSFNFGLGLFNQGMNLSFGAFGEGPGSVGQAFVTIGVPRNMVFVDGSASMQFLVGESNGKTFDLSGKSLTYGAGYGPISSSISRGVDNQGNITSTIIGFGPSAGIKYTGGGSYSRTFTMPVLFPMLFNLIPRTRF